MSSFKIEKMTKMADGNVMIPNNGKMNVKPVIRPMLTANRGIGTCLSSYSNKESLTNLRGDTRVIP
jgi:hypothetical protein